MTRPDPMNGPDDAGANDLALWLLQQGIEGATQEELLRGYCQKLVDLGLPLYRVHVAQSAFHPHYGGIGFDWIRDEGVSRESYEHSETPLEQWLNSPLYALLASGADEMRERLSSSNAASRFPILEDLKARGATDYYAVGIVLEKVDRTQVIDPNDTPEGVLISWTSDGPDGFADRDIDRLKSVMPHLGLALKSASNRQMAKDLLGVYLGRDAGNRVLSGELRRGSLRQIRAVICYFDLTGFTRLAEQTEGGRLIEMLNDYFGIAVSAIQSRDGHILKFMGDGLLAMFDHADQGQAAAAALDCAASLRRDIGSRNRERSTQKLPTTGFTLALHAGDILYGNIGAEHRLDFTAIGPAVNLTARLSGMHRALGRDMVVSEQVRDLAGAGTHDLVSLGRYMLRGVSEPLELFTIHDPNGGS